MQYTKVLYLNKANIDGLNISMKSIIEVVEKGFVELGSKRVEMPPKPGIHPGPQKNDNFIHAMPCFIPALNSCGVKWVSGYPPNQAKGLPYINGLLILNDVETGIAKAIMDCVWITAKRTAAASAISGKYLARPESESIGILACGVQGHTNLEAFAVSFPLKKVVLWDPDPTQAQKLAAFAKEKFELETRIVDSPKDAVEHMDIVVTSGPIVKNPRGTVKAGWLKKGAFVSMVDYDSSFSPEALAEADIFTTDDLAQYTYNKNTNGYFQKCPPVYAELGELVTGQKKGRTTQDQVTFACNLGIAMEDMALAPLIYEKAVEQNIGQWLPL